MYNWDDPINEALNKPELTKVSQSSEDKLIESNQNNNSRFKTGNTGLENIEQKTERIRVDDKAIINCEMTKSTCAFQI